MAFDKKIAELHNKIDCSYNDLNVKFEALNSKIKYVESQFASTSALKHPHQLPGKAIQNPKDYATANAITIHQEDESPPSHQTPNTEDSMIQEEGIQLKLLHLPSTIHLDYRAHTFAEYSPFWKKIQKWKILEGSESRDDQQCLYSRNIQEESHPRKAWCFRFIHSAMLSRTIDIQ